MPRSMQPYNPLGSEWYGTFDFSRVGWREPVFLELQSSTTSKWHRASRPLPQRSMEKGSIIQSTLLWVNFGNNPRPTHTLHGTLKIHVPRNLRTWKTVALVGQHSGTLWTFDSQQVQDTVWKPVSMALATHLAPDVVGVVMMYFW